MSFLSRKNYTEAQESYKTDRSETHGQGSFQDNLFLPRKAFQTLELYIFPVENEVKSKPRLSENQTLVSDSLVLSPAQSLQKSLPLASQCPVALGSLECGFPKQEVMSGQNPCFY